MNKNTILLSTLATLIVFLVISCAHREGDPDARTNPYDPGSGSDKWTQNTAPVISVSVDSLWYDFNHSLKTGIIRIHLQEDDLNFPYDTVIGSVFFNSAEIKLPRLLSKKDTTIQLSDIKAAITAQCTISVYDSKQSITSKVVNISAPDSLPSVPPQARVINSSQEVVLTWQQNPNTNYVVFYSDSLKGPYTDSITANQVSNSTVTIYNQPSGYLPRYFIVATTNKFGTARSTDTLIGRRYYSGISIPSINSISQGTYSAYIAVSINNYSYDLDYMEIYRSTNDTSAFRLIKKVKATSSSYLYFNDSVQTSATYYYRINAIDMQGRCSFPSSAQYGYLQRLYAPSLTVTPYPENSRLSWSTVSGAVKYRVYRSPINCFDSLSLLTETNLASYTDTPPTGNLYYYTVSGIASNGLEGSKSSCIQAKITILPKPDSIVVTTNYYPRHVALAWRKAMGANGYIIYRSKNYNDSIPIDTISNNTYNDTLPDNSLRYYRIAAFNNRGTGVLSSAYSGSVLTPVFSNYLSKNDSVFLTFTPNNRAIKYFVYRSSNQTDFTLIDSTVTSSYSAPLKDFSTWYYRFTIQTPEGVSFPSTTASIVRQLSTPYNIKITQLVNGIRMDWSKVVGAEKYDVYRSSSASSNTFYRTTTDTFFIDTLPEGSSLYYYALRSVNTSTTSPLSSKYQGGRMNRPVTPISITILGQLKTIYLSWSMPVSNTFPIYFNIYRSVDNTTFKKINSTENLYYSDSVPDTIQYYYRISAFNNAGESPMSNSYYAALARPSPPQNLTGTLATSKTYIRISWSPVTEINKYALYRSLSTNGTYEYLGSVSNTNIFYDSTCNVNTTYYYKAASITPDKQSGLSAYTIGIRLGPPAIKSVSKYDTGIEIAWDALSYTIQKYYIYSSKSIYGPFIKIDSTTSTSYRDTKGTVNSYYKVSSFNSVESDLSSASTSGNLNALAVSTTQGTKANVVDIMWTSVSNAIAYRVYRAPTDTFDRNISRIAEVKSTTYTDTVHTDSIYYYKVTALKASGETGFSGDAVPGFRYPTVKPFPVTHISISQYSANQNLISWEKPSTAVGYNRFNIFRSKSANGPFELINVINQLEYLDTPPDKDLSSYWYYVFVVNMMGESSASEKVSLSQKK